MVADPNMKILVVDDSGIMHDVMGIGKIIDFEKFVNKTFADN